MRLMPSSSSSIWHFSWIMKSCFPNPQNPHHTSPLLSAGGTGSISTLPDDLLLECLSRVPHSTLPSLPAVCRRWAYLLNSPAFPILRLRHHLLRPTLFSISISDSTLFTAALRFDSDSDTFWKLSSFLPSRDNAGGGPGNHENPFSAFSHFRLTPIGRKVYIIGPAAMMRCDTWTGTLVPKAGMGILRKNFAVATVAGKILVAGGCARSSAVEEYDPEENSWRVVSESPRRRYGCVGAAADGVFYIIGGLKIGPSGNDAGSATAAHLYASSMDLYDAAAGVWLRSRAVPGGGCAVAACAAAGHVYILASHTVELSFWKFNALRSSPNFGEWSKISGPPLPAGVRIDGTVRFGCVGVGQKVVVVQVGGCIDDLLRRSGRKERGLKEGLVLVYDCAADEWSKGAADMPEVMRRAACLCVEC